MVTTRILPLVARTMPITNAGVVTVQFSFFPCNYMQLTDIQYQNLKSSPFNPLMDRNPWTKGMREWGEESNCWGVQEMSLHPPRSSPLDVVGWPDKSRDLSSWCLPSYRSWESTVFICASHLEVLLKKKEEETIKKISGGDWVDKFSPFTLPPQF